VYTADNNISPYCRDPDGVGMVAPGDNGDLHGALLQAGLARGHGVVQPQALVRGE